MKRRLLPSLLLALALALALTACAAKAAVMAAITAMHTLTMHWDTGTGIFTPPPTETTVR